MSDREFDLIVFGASGYTGRLVAEHLLKAHGVRAEVRWAMAGRNPDKLAAVREEIGAPEALEILTADAADAASLAALVGRTRAIISTVGPYQKHGEPLVAACAAAGTDYVDLCGESHWIAAMIEKYDAAARASGARLVFSCGFDSIPFDLGVFFAQERARAAFGAPAPRVRGRVRGMKGGLSGGTLSSGMTTMMAARRNPAIGAVLADPFALTPGFKGPAQPDGDTAYFDEAAGAWAVPFMMAGINTKAVHRTNFLLGHPWGADFLYDEMLLSDHEPKAGETMGFDASAGLRPGDGPTREERESGWYDLVFFAEAADGRTARVAVKGDMDPGYGSTAKMLAEAALCLIDEVSRETTPGGAWSPAAAMSEALIARLTARAGLSFTVEA